jgi:purine-nucleoside phosphorylase
MLITDHVNIIGMGGMNPLRGPNLSDLESVSDMSQAYDRNLLALARKVAKDQKINLNEGVYICLAGPSFETPADLRYLSLIVGDAVGMSTVPETIIARHGGTKVLASRVSVTRRTWMEVRKRLMKRYWKLAESLSQTDSHHPRGIESLAE